MGIQAAHTASRRGNRVPVGPFGGKPWHTREIRMVLEATLPAQRQTCLGYAPNLNPDNNTNQDDDECNAKSGCSLAYITAGAGGMYCGSCMHDNTLARALSKFGIDVVLVPTYTPIRTDEENVSLNQVFFGGINVYLQQTVPLFRYLPQSSAISLTTRASFAGRPLVLRRLVPGFSAT